MKLLLQTTLIIALLTIGYSQLFISPLNCRIAYEREAWQHQFFITGGSGKYNLQYSGLPNWINVKQNRLYGTPTKTGRFQFTVKYSDGGFSRQRNTHVEVRPQYSGIENLWVRKNKNYYQGYEYQNNILTIIPSTTTTSTVCKLNADFSISFTATGGSGSYDWYFGTLPEGLISSGNRIYGKPSKSGIYNIRVTVKTSHRQTTSVVITITVEGSLQSNYPDLSDLRRAELASRDLEISQRQVAAAKAVKDALALVQANEIAANAAKLAFQAAASTLDHAQDDARDAADAQRRAQSAANNAANALTSAQNALNAAQNSLNNARNAADNADRAVTAAQNAYNQALASYNAAKTVYTNAKADLNAAQTAFKNAQSALAAAQSAYNIAHDNYDRAHDRLVQAQNALNQAQQNQRTTAAQLTQAQNNYAAAQTAFNNARTANDNAQTALTRAIANNNAAQSALTAAQNADNAANAANQKAQAALKAAKDQLYRAQCEKEEVDQQAALLLAQYAKIVSKTRQVYDGPYNRPLNCSPNSLPSSYGSARITGVRDGCYELESKTLVHIEGCTDKGREPKVGEYLNWHGHYQADEIWARKIW